MAIKIFTVRMLLGRSKKKSESLTRRARKKDECWRLGSIVKNRRTKKVALAALADW